jgi:hypothetical protein
METPALSAPVLPALESCLDGVVSALCEELPAPPQFVESDALTCALAVRTVSVPAVTAAPMPAVAAVSEAPPLPEFWLDVELEFETDAVDSSAAPTVMRAVEVEPVTLAAPEVTSDSPLLDLPVEARTRPEPVVLRNSLRPLLDQLPKAIADEPHEPVPETPTLGALATHLPILAPEQIAELSIAARVAFERRSVSSRTSDERTECMPQALPLSPLPPGVSLVESKKSDVKELVDSFQVVEPNINRGLCRAIKELADLDATPAPFAALIR